MRLQKTIAVFFFFMLFIGQVGYYFIYTIQQHYIKELAEEQILAGVPETLMNVIDAEANKKDIQWKEEGKEFYLHGQLYDIQKVKKTDGKTFLYCLNDKREARLLEDLSNAIRSGGDQNTDNKGPKHTIKFQLTDYITVTEKSAFIEQDPAQKYTNFNDYLVATIKEINTPPPRPALCQS